MGIGPNAVALRWNGACDDLAVKSYAIYDRGVVVKSPIGDFISPGVTLDLPSGPHWLQIQARNYARNCSVLSSPVCVVLA